jgi:uncharacterized protein (TIGR03437 family)
MKRTAGLSALLCALLLALASTIQAETLTATVPLTPGAEINPTPAPPADASAGFVVTITITRDPSGQITAGAINFTGTTNFNGPVTFTGLHIHEGDITINGPVRFDSGISSNNPLTFPDGKGVITLNATTVDVTILQRLLARPTGFYVNLHTTVNPDGAVRGQIVNLVETSANSVAMTTAQEVPPIPLPNVSGFGTITLNPVRNLTTGEITGGTVTFTVTADLPAPSTVTGLHIHENVAGMNGTIVIDTGVSAANPVILTTGEGTITRVVPITAANLAPFRRMVANPPGFYVNLHTMVNPGGLIRGQLDSFASPPVIQQSNTAFLPTGGTAAQVVLLATGVDLGTTFLVNGQQVNAGFDIATGAFTAEIPAAMLANAGTLLVQARNGAGVMSAPYTIVVAPQSQLNTDRVTSVDGAGFGTLTAPNAIVAGYGTKLATQNVINTSLPLPTSLGGTSVYVNGVAAGLFFVSAAQVNYLMPSSTLVGPAQVVIVASDGTVSSGTANVAGTAPGIFTQQTNGLGAPAGVASADGVLFNILLSNPDGTPVTIDPGNFVSLFGTGMRFFSNLPANAITIGGVNVPPLFIGAQPTFEGLDQVNLQIPAGLAGRGDVDLLMTLDGKTSNTVKLRIR